MTRRAHERKQLAGELRTALVPKPRHTATATSVPAAPAPLASTSSPATISPRQPLAVGERANHAGTTHHSPPLPATSRGMDGMGRSFVEEYVEGVLALGDCEATQDGFKPLPATTTMSSLHLPLPATAAHSAPEVPAGLNSQKQKARGRPRPVPQQASEQAASVGGSVTEWAYWAAERLAGPEALLPEPIAGPPPHSLALNAPPPAARPAMLGLPSMLETSRTMGMQVPERQLSTSGGTQDARARIVEVGGPLNRLLSLGWPLNSTLAPQLKDSLPQHAEHPNLPTGLQRLESVPQIRVRTDINAGDSVDSSAKHRVATTDAVAAAPASSSAKPFVCDFPGCSYASTKRRYLADHLKRHAGYHSLVAKPKPRTRIRQRLPHETTLHLEAAFQEAKVAEVMILVFKVFPLSVHCMATCEPCLVCHATE